jgi:PAS domain S-box-containing protein
LISQNKSSIKEMVSVSEPFKSKAGNLSGYALLFTSPLNIKPLDINASVSIIVSCDNVIKLIDQSVSGKNSSSLLVTSTNSIIGVSAKHWMTGKNIIKFQGEEHEIFTQLKSINQNVFQYKDKVISNHEIKVEHSNISWNLISSIPISNSITRFNQTIIYIVIALMLLLLSGLVIILFLLKNALIPFKLIIESAKKIGNGELITISKGNFEHEFNEIINGINNITENLKEVTQVSAEIAQGNIESKIKIKSENDILSISVNKIADNLKQSILDREAQADLTNKQLWMRRGRFEVAEAERMSSEKQDDLAFNLIRSIVNYCDASMGGVYTYDSETEKIILIAAYAYGNKKMIKKEFIKGEGLVGTCVLEKKKIELTKIPDDYLKITTGLGSGTPGYLIIIPVFFQEKINSVLEIAFNRKPENHIVEFIEQVCESIGGWLDASAKKNKTIELLQISREQTKQLAEKEAELNTKINELQLIQNQIAIKNAEYQSILKAVNHSVMTVNYTPEGVLLDANEVYLGIMGYTLDELKGMNVFDLVKDQEKDLKTIIERVMIGETIHKQVKRYTKEGAEKWLSATYTPFVNADNLITGVLFFAVEINNVIFDKQAG